MTLSIFQGVLNHCVEREIMSETIDSHNSLSTLRASIEIEIVIEKTVGWLDCWMTETRRDRRQVFLSIFYPSCFPLCPFRLFLSFFFFFSVLLFFLSFLFLCIFFPICRRFCFLSCLLFAFQFCLCTSPLEFAWSLALTRYLRRNSSKKAPSFTLFYFLFFCYLPLHSIFTSFFPPLYMLFFFTSLFLCSFILNLAFSLAFFFPFFLFFFLFSLSLSPSLLFPMFFYIFFLSLFFFIFSHFSILSFLHSDFLSFFYWLYMLTSFYSFSFNFVSFFSFFLFFSFFQMTPIAFPLSPLLSHAHSTTHQRLQLNLRSTFVIFHSQRTIPSSMEGFFQFERSIH